ncbi:MAG: transcriptional regulator/antitoxin, MazE [Gemmatimonadetes bacterium]|nr:transcriptional regulator/antitoxin, MazE [Gemmatimonadota bacterium]MDE3258463.1 transcriptional regulator/antitoxin, MazE [Gemmatimonadota bacterium]
MVTRVQKWGNSQGLRFSKAIMTEARINVGDQVNVSVNDGQIIVEPFTKVRGKYDLRELVSRMPTNDQVEETEWGGPTGKEAW